MGEPNGATARPKTKDIFTTGEAARICRLSQQTIIRCFDAGRLQGFKVPGSRFRRIPRNELVRFMKANDIPLSALGGQQRRVLVVSSDERVIEVVKRAAGDTDRFDVRVATNPFDAGMLLEQFGPHLLIVDADMAHLDARAVVRRVLASSDLRETKAVIVGSALRGDTADLLLAAGAAAVHRKPVDASVLLQRVEELAA